MKKGFVLVETLIAAALAALLLPSLVRCFDEYLRTSLELRQRQEAARLAQSCLDAVEALGSVPSQTRKEENLFSSLGDYQIEIEQNGSDHICRVTVRWADGTRELVLSRELR